MNFRWPNLLIIAMSAAVVATAAHGSYVVEADGANISTEAIAAGADFDFVAQDFGIEAAEAIQITLSNLSDATNVRGNLLLWSFSATTNPPSVDTAQDELPSAVSPDTTALVTPGSSEDYSYYDEGIGGVGKDGAPVPSGEPLAASIKDLPAIDTNAVFWILKPAEFTSFSQMTAARFGFTVGHDQNSN